MALTAAELKLHIIEESLTQENVALGMEMTLSSASFEVVTPASTGTESELLAMTPLQGQFSFPLSRCV